MNRQVVCIFLLASASLRAGSGHYEGLDSLSAVRPAFYADNSVLEGLVRQALDRNPSIQEELGRYRSSLQRIPQVKALPDPMLNFTQFIRSLETRVGPQVNSLSLSQKFPWFGKLSLKGQVALKEAAAVYQTYRARQREIIAQVKDAYYDLVYVDRAAEIAREEQILLEHYEELARARFASGQGLQQAVIKLQAEISKVINRLLLLDRQRKSLAARLNTLVDRPPHSPVGATNWLPLPQVPLDLEELYRIGEHNRQELKSAMARAEAGEKAVQLAGKSFWPDVTLSAGYVNVDGRDDLAGLLVPPPDNGKDSYRFSIGINLPIQRKKYRAGIAEATETLIARRKNYLDLRNEMEFSIRDQVIRIETLRGQIDLFERVLIPQADEALRSTESAYQTGQVDALDLLDSERVLLEVRLVNARFYIDFLRALSDLERALGTKFPK